MYKMASGTRPDRPLLDLMGPWFRGTPWPRIWWNLNIQLTYWPQLASNRLELGESLLKALDDHKPALARNARPWSDDSYAIGRSSSYDLERTAKPEIGNLTWTLHNYYLQYRYSMDEAMLRDRLFPLLKGSVNYYLHLLKEDADGKLHIPLGLSPEYPEQPDPNPDTNYDLSLLRWGCQTLLAICERLKIDDPLIPKWKDTLERLTPYPVDENGLMISPSTPFRVSHRHYSHLLMIYPLYTMSLEQPENRALVEKSLDHWMGLESALRGYSYTGAVVDLLAHGSRRRRPHVPQQAAHRPPLWRASQHDVHRGRSGGRNAALRGRLAARYAAHELGRSHPRLSSRARGLERRDDSPDAHRRRVFGECRAPWRQDAVCAHREPRGGAVPCGHGRGKRD